ncbi:hypothetical protein [Candidatus Poriferisocius sp.]|uniref:hypothetical protein n=1 Tax=Candidatus Poriferisocius sp. TaxID=3101276 RepID=UPI003B01191A
MEAIDAEILDQLKQLEDGQIDVYEFEDWLVPNTWDTSTPLIAEINHTLAEKSLLTEDQLISELLSFAKAAVLRPASTA